MADFKCPKCGLQIGKVQSATCGKHGPMKAQVSINTTKFYGPTRTS